jgi:tRNA pseudouridine38-40 synthase
MSYAVSAEPCIRHLSKALPNEGAPSVFYRVIHSYVYLCCFVRYFITLAYRGTNYIGWQRQPKGTSVQGTLEAALTTVMRQPIEITGCGRTDTGVHATYYIAHFDADAPVPDSLLRSLNGLLPFDIAVYSVRLMHDTAHARFDAHERAYEYQISLRKDPFRLDTAWFLPTADHLDLDLLNAAAQLLLNYTEFATFCKTNSDVDTYKCDLRAAYWERGAEGQLLVFHIVANRFLRGMVRLIVGACVSVAKSQLTLDDLRQALDAQKPLAKNLSVPAHGLALTRIEYPYEVGYTSHR